MHYDKENDKIVFDNSDLEIYPYNPQTQTFFGSKTIEIDIDDGYIRVPVDQIDELIDGLNLAKTLINQK